MTYINKASEFANLCQSVALLLSRIETFILFFFFCHFNLCFRIDFHVLNIGSPSLSLYKVIKPLCALVPTDSGSKFDLKCYNEIKFGAVVTTVAK